MTTPPPSPRQGPTGGRGTVHGDLSQMASPPRISGVLYYAVLAVAAGIDIATFYQVLALVMRNVPDQVVWLGVVGFTVTALALAHTMGIRARDQVDNGKRVLASPSVWLLFVIWLFVGVTAFIVRLTAAPPQSTGGTTIIEEGQLVINRATGPDDALLAALLFLALYFATGAVAGVAGYLRHNTAAKRYEATLRNRSDVAKLVAASAADLALARQTLVALEEERRRREEGWVKAQEEWQAIARRLKQEVRLRLASAAQNPSVTDAYFEPPPSLRRPTSGAPAAPAHSAPGDGAAVSPAPYGSSPPMSYGAPPSSYGPAPGSYGAGPAGAPHGPASTGVPLQTHSGQAAVPAQVWPMNPPSGTDHREVSR
jgi:hypothetical protein